MVHAVIPFPDPQEHALEMLEHEDLWTRFMTERWSAGACTACDVERERGEPICNACGSAIQKPARRRRRDRRR
jgi:hypothetical protein